MIVFRFPEDEEKDFIKRIVGTPGETMEDIDNTAAVLRELGQAGVLNKSAVTVNGKTIWDNNKDAPCYNREVVFPYEKPFKPAAGIALARIGSASSSKTTGGRGSSYFCCHCGCSWPIQPIHSPSKPPGFSLPSPSSASAS